MNKHQLLVFGLSAAVLFTACKKNRCSSGNAGNPDGYRMEISEQLVQ